MRANTSPQRSISREMISEMGLRNFVPPWNEQDRLRMRCMSTGVLSRWNGVGYVYHTPSKIIEAMGGELQIVKMRMET